MTQNIDQLLTRKLAKFRHDPLGYVLFNWDWDGDESIQQVPLQEPWRTRYGMKWGPDKWACELLDQLGEEIKKRNFKGKGGVPPIRFSTSSGHGIGKSALVAWLIMYILDTRPMSMGIVTATTGDQLKTKTWAELGKWHHKAHTSHFWEYSNTRGNMALARRDVKAINAKWRCDAYTCKEENAEAFAGLHAAGSVPFYIFDEASGVPDPLWEVRYGGATDGMPMSFDFGNPTRKSGYFFENTIGKFRHRHIVRIIDSRDVAITNKEEMQNWAEDFGEDSDFFKVRVRGIFPSTGSVQFIGDDLVDDAMRRSLPETQGAPLLIGVDVARFGKNNTVIVARIGKDVRSFGFKEYNGLDLVQVTEKVIEVIQHFESLGKRPSGLFVDGGGLGGGPVDMLRRLGYNPIDCNFGARSSDSRYQLKRDEMWGKMRDDLQYLALPKDNDLRDQLVQREYAFTVVGNKIQLESKESMRERRIPSPDKADALALTYYAEPADDITTKMFGAAQRSRYEYDPLDISL